MLTRRVDNTMIIRLDTDEELISSVLEVCRQNRIRAGYLTAIGAASSAAIAILNMETKQYDRTDIEGPFEITCAAGDIGELNGEPYAHIHISLARSSGEMVGGHCVMAKISVTGEVFLHILDTQIDHKFNPRIGINEMQI